MICYACKEYTVCKKKGVTVIKRPKPIDEEVLFDGRSLISETDLKGIITFANRKAEK